MSVTDEYWFTTDFRPEGVLTFVLEPGCEPPATVFNDAAKLADRDRPWQPELQDVHPDDLIKLATTPATKSEYDHRTLQIRFEPTVALRPDQLSDYRRYLCGLADHILEQCLPDVIAVHARIELIGTDAVFTKE